MIIIVAETAALGAVALYFLHPKLFLREMTTAPHKDWQWRAVKAGKYTAKS